jgi:Uma2 family endonuclease
MSIPAVQDAKTISYEEFLATIDEATHAEWVDGEVVQMTPPSDEHARIALFLASVMQAWIEMSGIGGTVRTAPYEMKLSRSSRQPDVIWASPARDAHVTLAGLKGPADLVVEVVSPESRTRDRREKFREYAAEGVREYWLVDPMRRLCEVYALNDGGDYELVSGEGPRAESRVMPGFWVDLQWVWAAKLQILLVLDAWRGA